MTWSANGGQGATELKLKWWCKEDHECADRLAHRGLPESPAFLPALEDLEAWIPDGG